jgi:hypothetical protein
MSERETDVSFRLLDERGQRFESGNMISAHIEITELATGYSTLGTMDSSDGVFSTVSPVVFENTGPYRVSVVLQHDSFIYSFTSIVDVPEFTPPNIFIGFFQWVVDMSLVFFQWVVDTTLGKITVAAMGVGFFILIRILRLVRHKKRERRGLKKLKSDFIVAHPILRKSYIPSKSFADVEADAVKANTAYEKLDKKVKLLLVKEMNQLDLKIKELFIVSHSIIGYKDYFSIVATETYRKMSKALQVKFCEELWEKRRILDCDDALKATETYKNLSEFSQNNLLKEFEKLISMRYDDALKATETYQKLPVSVRNKLQKESEKLTEILIETGNLKKKFAKWTEGEESKRKPREFDIKFWTHNKNPQEDLIYISKYNTNMKQKKASFYLGDILCNTDKVPEIVCEQEDGVDGYKCWFSDSMRDIEFLLLSPKELVVRSKNSFKLRIENESGAREDSAKEHKLSPEPVYRMTVGSGRDNSDTIYFELVKGDDLFV